MPPFDLHALIADIAGEFSGAVIDPGRDHGYARLSLENGAVALSFRTGYGSTADKITIHGSLPFDAVLGHHQRTQLGPITVTGTRPAAAIATDIRRRLLEGIEGKIAEARAKVDANLARRQALRDLVERWIREFPGLTCRINHDEDGASLHYYENDIYLAGDVRADGEITIQRVSVKGREMSEALLKLLTSKA